jgi:hypothetical protein
VRADFVLLVALAAACSGGGAGRKEDRLDLGDPDVPLLMARAARAQAAIPDGQVTDPRPTWRERVPDIVGLTVTSVDEKVRTNTWLRVVDGRVVVPAGTAQAARELAELRVLDHQPWDGGLIYIVNAVGGAMPGWQDTPHAEETALPGGGVRITIKLTQATLEHALAGAPGPAPSPTQPAAGAGGVTPPPLMGTATLDIGRDYALTWRYQIGDRVVEGPNAAPAAAPPKLSSEDLMTALEGARHRARAPRAMPSLEPRLLENIPNIAEIPLVGHGPVYVDLRGAAGRSAVERLADLNAGWASAAAGDLVLLLSAVDALPAGLVPSDLMQTARVERGVLIADVPTPLVAWAAGGARQLSPRVAGVAPPGAMAQTSRIALRLEGEIRWELGRAR